MVEVESEWGVAVTGIKKETSLTSPEEEQQLLSDYLETTVYNRDQKYMPDVPDPEGEDPNAVPEDPIAQTKFYTLDGGQSVARQKDPMTEAEIWKNGAWVPDKRRHLVSEGVLIDADTARHMIKGTNPTSEKVTK